MFFIGVTAAAILGYVLLWKNGYISFDVLGSAAAVKGISALIMGLCFGFVGFLDDYIKVKKSATRD